MNNITIMTNAFSSFSFIPSAFITKAVSLASPYLHFQSTDRRKEWCYDGKKNMWAAAILRRNDTRIYII